MANFEHNVQRTAPEKIYLQIGDDPLDLSVSFDELMNMGDVSWCQEQIFDGDVPYVRGDIVFELRAKVDNLEELNGNLTLILNSLPQFKVDTSTNTIQELHAILRDFIDADRDYDGHKFYTAIQRARAAIAKVEASRE